MLRIFRLDEKTCLWLAGCVAYFYNLCQVAQTERSTPARTSSEHVWDRNAHGTCYSLFTKMYALTSVSLRAQVGGMNVTSYAEDYSLRLSYSGGFWGLCSSWSIVWAFTLDTYVGAAFSENKSWCKWQYRRTMTSVLLEIQEHCPFWCQITKIQRCTLRHFEANATTVNLALAWATKSWWHIKTYDVLVKALRCPGLWTVGASSFFISDPSLSKGVFSSRPSSLNGRTLAACSLVSPGGYRETAVARI